MRRMGSSASSGRNSNATAVSMALTAIGSTKGLPDCEIQLQIYDFSDNFCYYKERLAMVALKVRKIGNSVGVVLPKEVASRLRVTEGDQLLRDGDA